MTHIVPLAKGEAGEPSSCKQVTGVLQRSVGEGLEDKGSRCILVESTARRRQVLALCFAAEPLGIGISHSPFIIWRMPAGQDSKVRVDAA